MFLKLKIWNEFLNTKLGNTKVTYSIKFDHDQLMLVLFGEKTYFDLIMNWLNDLLMINIDISQDEVNIHF